MAYTPTIRSQDTNGTSADGILLLNGATPAQAAALGAVLAVGDNLGTVRFYIDAAGQFNMVPYPDPTDPLILGSQTGAIPAGTWLYAYTLAPIATGGNGETILSPTTEIVLDGSTDVLFSGPTVPLWAQHATVYRSADAGANWYQIGPGHVFGAPGEPLDDGDHDATAAPTDTGVPNGGNNTTLLDLQATMGSLFLYGSLTAAAEPYPNSYPGGVFTGGINLVPTAATGHPASGLHGQGEMVMDSAGTLFACTVTGTPGTWVQITVS